MAARTLLTRRRVSALAAAVVVLLAGLAVHGLLPDSAATDIAGDALYAAMISALVVAVAPRLPSVAAGAIAVAWCVGVELFQLTGVPERVGDVFPPAVLVLGTVFDARDLVVYAATIAVVTLVDVVFRRADQRRDRR